MFIHPGFLGFAFVAGVGMGCLMFYVLLLLLLLFLLLVLYLLFLLVLYGLFSPVLIYKINMKRM